MTPEKKDFKKLLYKYRSVIILAVVMLVMTILSLVIYIYQNSAVLKEQN